MEQQKSAYWKFVRRFLGIILVSLAIVLAVGFFAMWQREKGVENLARSLEEIQRKQYERAMADIYGGKTPQETLRLYIEAVEAGDYELASRYFVEENRTKELESSNRMTENAIQNYTKLLSDALNRIDIVGNYDSDKKYFSIYKPILVRMTLYPNGTWKIVEI